MYSEIPIVYLITSIVLSLITVILLVIQLVLSNRLHILSICKVFVVIPLAYLLVVTTRDISKTLLAERIANDLSLSVWQSGIVSATASISFGIILTAILSIAYSVTSTIIRNRTKKSSPSS